MALTDPEESQVQAGVSENVTPVKAPLNSATVLMSKVFCISSYFVLAGNHDDNNLLTTVTTSHVILFQT